MTPAFNTAMPQVVQTLKSLSRLAVLARRLMPETPGGKATETSSMSISILVAQIGPGRFVNHLSEIASRLVISRRSPSMVTTTLSLNASTSSTGSFFWRGPCGFAGLAFLESAVHPRLAAPTS